MSPTAGATTWSGGLGDSTTTTRPAPTEVAGGLTFRAISAGGLFTCAVAMNGAPYCWGANGGGQLGDGTTQARRIPTPVKGGLVL